MSLLWALVGAAVLHKEQPSTNYVVPRVVAARCCIRTIDRPATADNTKAPPNSAVRVGCSPNANQTQTGPRVNSINVISMISAPGT